MGQKTRIVSWNCNGALRQKLRHLDQLNADILVIQECEKPAHSTLDLKQWAGQYYWTGSSKHKGLGVFVKNGSSIKLLNWQGTYKVDGFLNTSAAHQWSTSELKLFLPVQVGNLTILAVWTKGKDEQVFGYIGQLWKYLHIHHLELSQPNTMIIGDMNSNARWDKPDRWWNHTDVVNTLNALGFDSLYHHQSGEPQGKESLPTFYMHRNQLKPYHIDYAFMSKDLIQQSSLLIGGEDEWLVASDHLPLIIDLPAQAHEVM
ncbi:endonuclease/exonuclease/phosphatase family protein [Nitrincola schmidtii]|uniref:endonuclease/exonuclease/phosphatase family protein n=1 Tax=Nitrincola schmidtii TaxID=1730894 RepID=UPI00124EBCDE|nr:endonuclease/exonuclease/phosphatase family protein [Nitrincola schmidtii]